jgi:hypothetical protein
VAGVSTRDCLTLGSESVPDALTYAIGRRREGVADMFAMMEWSGRLSDGQMLEIAEEERWTVVCPRRLRGNRDIRRENDMRTSNRSFSLSE